MIHQSCCEVARSGQRLFSFYLLLFLSRCLPSLVFLDKAGQHLVSLHLKLVHHLLALHAASQLICLCLGEELQLARVVYRARSESESERMSASGNNSQISFEISSK